MLKEVATAERLGDYEAVDVLWVALLKAANRIPGKSEHTRMLKLVDTLPEASIREVLATPDVEVLLSLDPPLETVAASPLERLDPKMARKALATILDSRNGRPREALVALGELLKSIRNKRAHGFKSRESERDVRILRSARGILTRLCELVAM